MSTSVAQSPTPILQFLSNAGLMNVGGSLLTQVGGVNYPTWQDAAGSTPLPNPIPLNSRGEISNSSGVSVPLYLAQGVVYQFTLYDAHGNQIWVDENVIALGEAATGQMTDEKGAGGLPGFVAGVDFTSGVTTSLTLAGFYGSAANLWVAFDGVEQGADTYSLSGYVLTFNAPIPVGVLKVYVKGGTTATIGTLGSGTVTDTSVASGSKLYNRINDIVDIKDPAFGAKGDGITNDSQAVQNWLQYLCTTGGCGYVSPGNYLLESSVIVTLNASFNVECSSDATFTAASGFPAGYKLFQFLTGTAQVNVLKWIGGQFDGRNIPNSTAGQANDIFGINATNVNHVHVELDRTYSGANWLNSGADSHLFIAGGSESIIARIGDCVGAWDAGIYISRDINGALGTNLHASGNFTGCNVGVIVKREFQIARVEANCNGCLNGASVGVANITSAALANGGKNYTFIVNADSCENAVDLQAMYAGNVYVTATNLGASISGYTSTQATALRMQGSQSVGGTVVASGVNPACTSNANFNAVRTEQMVITAATLQSTDNMLSVVSNTIGRSVRENDSSDRNTFLIKDYGSATGPSLVGANSIYLMSDGTPRWTMYGVTNQVAKTFATLPASPNAGDRAFISDSTVDTYRTPVTVGGGTYQTYINYLSGTWVVA